MILLWALKNWIWIAAITGGVALVVWFGAVAYNMGYTKADNACKAAEAKRIEAERTAEKKAVSKVNEKKKKTRAKSNKIRKEVPNVIIREKPANPCGDASFPESYRLQYNESIKRGK